MNLPLVLQIAANLIALAVALWLGWSPAYIILLFWAENIVVALWQVPRILLAGGDDPLPSRLFLIGFFLVHYGLFTFVHGVFVFQLFLHQNMNLDTLAAFFGQHGPMLAVAGMMAAHGGRFVTDLSDGTLARLTPQKAMSEPYGRIVVLHLVVIGSGFLLEMVPMPVVGLVLLTLVKTMMDIRHGRLRAPVKEIPNHVA